LAGKFDRAHAAFERVEALENVDDLARARTRRKRGRCSMRLSLYDEAWAWFEQARALVPDRSRSAEEDSELIEIELGLGSVAFNQGRFDAAVNWNRRAMERAERADGDPQILAHAYD